MITKLNFTYRTITSYAIRKLTPKECFRLMGVRDNVVGMMQTPPYDRMFEQSRRVYSAQGISPTLHTQGGVIERLRYWWSCKNVRSISPTTPIFAHITDMIRMRLTSFSFVSSGDKQKQHFIYDTTSALGRLHSHTYYRRAASWQHTGVHPQAHRRQDRQGMPGHPASEIKDL